MTSIRYGPFPRPWLNTAAIGVALALAGIAAWFGSSDTLTCTRGGDCVIATRYVVIPGGDDRFAADTLARVEYAASAGWRGGGALDLYTDDDRRHVALSTQSDDARDALPAVRAFIAGEVDRIEVGSGTPLMIVAILAGLAALIAIWLIELVRRPGRIELAVDRAAGEVRVRARWPLGIARTRVIRLTDVTAVRTELDEVRPMLWIGGPIRGGRVVLAVDGDRDPRPITRGLLAGTEVHTAVARELAAALAIPVTDVSR